MMPDVTTRSPIVQQYGGADQSLNLVVIRRRKSTKRQTVCKSSRPALRTGTPLLGQSLDIGKRSLIHPSLSFRSVIAGTRFKLLKKPNHSRLPEPIPKGLKSLHANIVKRSMHS
jgi:hypothetical protein